MKRKSIIFMILMLVVGAALGTGGTLAAQKFLQPKTVSAQPVPKPDGPLVSIGDFMVNLQGGAFLKTSITLEGMDAKSAAVLSAKESFLQDRVNTVLSNESVADVSTTAGKEKLRQELLTQLNQVADGEIQDVLFTSFIYQ